MFRCREMLAGRLLRLCSVCKRAVYSAGQESLRWRTLQGHSGVNLWRSVVPVRLLHTDWTELYEKESVLQYLQQLVEEHRELGNKLQRAHLNETERKLMVRRHTKLLPVADALGRMEGAMKDLEEVVSLLHGTKDEDMAELLKEEEAQISSKIVALREELIRVLVPDDPLDVCDVMLEVVSGRTTGGDICQQFTREMFDMYEGYALYRNWDFDVLNYSPAEYGGLHHAAARVSGENVYRHLKHEGGTHRVQRIPEVGLSSRMQRIHTGTMTVIVLPQPAELDVHIDPKDLRVDTFRSRGAGGQSVNTTDSAVRIVHLPTGISAECQQTRSQLQNRDTAMRMLRARLYQGMLGKETEHRLMARKQQVGTRSQSERIRTYNFSQDRITDHRTGYSTRDIKEFMRGGEPLDDLICDVLQNADREALLEAAESNKQPESQQPSD